MKAVYLGIVLACVSALALGYLLAAAWPDRQVEATIAGWAGGMVYLAWVWPALVDTVDDPPVLRTLGSNTPGCPAVGHAVDDGLGPRFTGRLMCWRPQGHRWHHYDKARQVYWSNE